MKLLLRTIFFEGNVAVTSDSVKPSLVIRDIFVTDPTTFYLETRLKSETNDGFVSWLVFMFMFLTEHRWQLSEQTTYKKFYIEICNIK